MRRPEEKGIALLTVLLLVAVMAVIAGGVLDDIRFGVRRAANVRSVGQAQWYALGAEDLARARIGRLFRADSARTTLAGDWNGREFAFPVEHGVIRARIADGTACFNLNSVVQETDRRFVRRETGVRQYRRLLELLGFGGGRGQQLAADLVDWIDSDDLPSGGAEDGEYGRMRPARRTAGTLLSEASELRAVRGYSAEVYDRIRPYVCALPTADLSPVNVNTLPADKALLITVITDGAVPVQAAAGAIGRRPEGGWADLQTFWNEPSLVEHTPAGEAREQPRLRTRFFTLQSDVAYADATATLTSLIEVDNSGRITLAARRWTRDE